jgi:hypothetical protein
MIHSDLTLSAAFMDAQAKAVRMKHGRLTLVVEKLDGYCEDWNVHVDSLNTADVERLMRTKPKGWR